MTGWGFLSQSNRFICESGALYESGGFLWWSGGFIGQSRAVYACSGVLYDSLPVFLGLFGGFI